MITTPPLVPRTRSFFPCDSGLGLGLGFLHLGLGVSYHIKSAQQVQAKTDVTMHVVDGADLGGIRRHRVI